MRKIRLLVCLFFVVSCICYGVHAIKELITKDKNPPVITIEETTLRVGEGFTEKDLFAGVTAKDEEDGDLTDRVQIASISRFQSDGSRTVQYIVFDNASQLGIAERTIVYDGYIPPRIYLKEPLRFTANTYWDEMETLEITAEDFIDGDISSQVRFSYGDNVYEVEPGDYPVTFQVNNSAGEACIVQVQLTIVDSSGENGKYYPLLNDYIAYTKVGEKLDYQSFLKGIESSSVTYVFGEAGTPANISASKVTIEDHVDYETPGTYTVTFSYTTRDNVTAKTVMFVVVED